AWTEEALGRMEKIPIFARGVAKTAIHRYAIEKGHTIISNTVVDAAVGHILPKGAMDAMKALGGSLDAAGIDRNKMQADDAVAKAEGTLETELAYDDVPMQWTKDAKEAIRAVPAGFQRRRAKAKIEKTARKLGMTTITLEYAAPMIKEAAAEDYTPIFANKGAAMAPAAEAERAAAETPLAQGGNGASPSPYTWTSEAQQRLERVPAGFMRDCTRALIHKHADKL